MDTSDVRKAGFGGVRVATVNYWHGLPVPVFLCVHEQESNRLFVAPVKQQVRRRFRELGDQETFRFDLVSSFDLTEADGTGLLMLLYLRERAFEGFAEALLDLLFHRESYADYIEGNVELDFFLEVDLAEIMRLNRLFSHCRRVAEFSGLPWPVQPLTDFIQEDGRLFREEYTLLHERTHGLVLRQLAPMFVHALRKGVDLVARQERDF
jgi:hypothetical protein